MNAIVRCNHLQPDTDILTVLQTAQLRPAHGAENQRFAVVNVADDHFFIQGPKGPTAGEVIRLKFSNGAQLDGRVIGDTTGKTYGSAMFGRLARGAALVLGGAALTLGLAHFGFTYPALGAGVATFLGVGLYRQNLTRLDNFIDRHTLPERPVSEGGRAIATGWEPTGTVFTGDGDVIQARAA